VRPVKDPVPVRQSDATPVGGVRAVSRLETLDHHLVADLHGIPLPALMNQSVGTSGLASPIHHAAVGRFDVHVKKDVGVLPVNPRHHAFQGDGLLFVELFAEGVMRRGSPNKQRSSCEQAKGSILHESTHLTG
jgi:hypothetical protein